MTNEELKLYLYSGDPVKVQNRNTGDDGIFGRVSGIIYRKDKKTGGIFIQAEVSCFVGNSVIIASAKEVTGCKTTMASEK